MTVPPASGRSLALLLLLALLHGAALASIKPMLQVSDELSYLSGAQFGAQEHWLADDAPLRLRVAPPDGVVVYWPPAGKPAFRIVAGGLLAAASTVAEPAGAAVAVRLVMALTLPLAVLFTWRLARELAPEAPEIALGASTIVALQPVFASVAGGIGPDAPANAASALALWLLARFALGRSGRFEPLLLFAAIGAAIAFKDTGFFLGAGLIAALLVRARRMRAAAGAWRAAVRADPWLLIVPAALLLPAVSPASWQALFRSPYLREARLDAALPFAVLRATLEALPRTFVSFWTSLGNFGAAEVHVAAAWVVAAALASIAALAGLALYLRRPAPWETAGGRRDRLAVFAVFAVGGAVLLVQPAVRLVVTAQPDEFQGRWLFPFLPALAVYACVGLSARLSRPGLLLPALGLGMAGVALASLALVLVPHYYATFPGEYRVEQLYLLGPYGRPADPARVLPFVSADAVPGLARVLALAAFGAAALCVPFALAGAASLTSTGEPGRRPPSS